MGRRTGVSREAVLRAALVAGPLRAPAEAAPRVTVPGPHAWLQLPPPSHRWVAIHIGCYMMGKAGPRTALVNLAIGVVPVPRPAAPAAGPALERSTFSKLLRAAAGAVRVYVDDDYSV